MKKEYPDILKLEGEKWHNPDPATGKLGTRVPAEWLQTTEDSLKSLTLEMLEVLKSAGINPNELNNTQVRDAIQKMILARVINYNDIQGRPVVKDSLGDDRNNPASQRVVNDVNRDVVTAQKTANTANDKANAAQTTANQAKNAAATADSKAVRAQGRADDAYNEANKKRDLSDSLFKSSSIKITTEEGWCSVILGLGKEGLYTTRIENQPLLGRINMYIRNARDDESIRTFYTPLDKSGTFALREDLLGYSQKLQNVTGNRMAGVNYTNNTGKPIYMFAIGDGVTLGIIIDGVKLGGGTGSNYISAIIPEGSVYSVYKGGSGSIGTGEITSWGEIR